MVKLVMDGEADISASSMSVNSERSKVVTIVEMYTDKTRLVYKRQPIHTMSTYRIVFKSETWLLFGIAVVTLWVVFVAYSKLAYPQLESSQKRVLLSG